MPIFSPLTVNSSVHELESLAVSDIVKKYREVFDIDVSSYFSDYEIVSIYECAETHYRFYYPFDIAGDSDFYHHFEQYDWYYMPWKWEHRQAAKFINSGMKVLEIGCGNGAFLQKLISIKQLDVVGLELNKSVKNKQVKILNETVQEHSVFNSEHYDIICSFQVMEHISDVKDFLYSQIKCLKTGGKLIVSVPNNKSFIKYTFEDNILNMPPHHMGLWDRKSLKNLENIFNIKLIKIHNEPLQKYHRAWYRNVLQLRFSNYKIFRWSYNYLKIKHLINFFITHFNFMVKGHTILAIYEKL